TLEGISSGKDFNVSNSYSIWKIFNALINRNAPTIITDKAGFFDTKRPTLLQNAFGFVSFAPTFGIRGQNDFLPKIVKIAGTKVTDAIVTTTIVMENNGAKLFVSPKLAKNKI